MAAVVVAAATRSSTRIESLERRILLAHVGLDLGFGDAGYAPVDASLLVAPLPGGKVLAVGELGAVRLNPDGTLDEVFVDRGTKSDVERDADVAAVAGQQLFIAGQMHPGLSEEGWPIQQIFVRKVNLRTGGTGAGFGTDGLVLFAPAAAVADARLDRFALTSMIPTSDGGVIIAVTESFQADYPSQQTPQAIVVQKLGATGKLDKSFGHNGAVTTTLLEDYDYLTPPRLAVYGDGRFLLLGGTESNPTLARFNADGSLDQTFGDAGVLALENSPFCFINVSLARPLVQPDGKILLPVSAADISFEFSTSFLVRFNADGTRDTSFGAGGSGGEGTVDFGREDDSNFPSDVALDSAGRIIGIVRDAELYRLTPAGQPDPTFDDDGFTTANYARANLAIDAAGNILLAGSTSVSRFADGLPRVRLGSDGVVHLDGTAGADTITTALAGDMLTVTINAQSATFAAEEVVSFLVTGAGGNDVIDVAAVPAAASVNGGDGNDSIATGDGNDHINCGDGDDTVHAGGGPDLIFGGDGGDSIWGDGGDDHVFGEFGSDSIFGGDGNDRLYGGHTTLLEQGEYTDTWDGDDSISGNTGNDRCNGQFGNDRVAGNGGRDRLFGGGSQDRLYGGTGGDWLYSGGGGRDQLFGEGGNDRLYADEGGVEAVGWEDTLHGGTGDDTLFSRNTNVDYVFGDRGHDTSAADEDDILASIELRT